MINKNIHIGPDHRGKLTLFHFTILKHHTLPRTGQYNESPACRNYTEQFLQAGYLAWDSGMYRLTEDGEILLRAVISRLSYALEGMV